MNTKKILSLFAFILIPFFSNYGMDRVDKVCNEIKKIKISAQQKEYEALALKMKEQGLSTCDCIKQLTWNKKEQALKELLPEYKGSTAYYPSWNISVECSNQVPKYLCEKINEECSQKTSNPDFTAHGFIDFDSSYPGAAYSANRAGDYHSFFIGINPLAFNTLAPDAQKSVIKHELEHILLGHNHTNNELKNLSETDSFKKFRRAQENEADRIPAACESELCIAKGHQEFYERELKLFASALPKVYEDICVKRSSNNSLLRQFAHRINPQKLCSGSSQEFSNKLWRILDPEHTHAQKNLEWAVKIASLRKAEKNLK